MKNSNVFVEVFVFEKLLRFQQNAKEGPKKYPVYLKLPWIGENSLKFNRKIKLAITNCFGAVQPRVVFSAKRVLPAMHKNVLPAFQQRNVVHKCVCTAIVGTWVKGPNICRTEFVSMCRSLFGIEPV